MENNSKDSDTVKEDKEENREEKREREGPVAVEYGQTSQLRHPSEPVKGENYSLSGGNCNELLLFK